MFETNSDPETSTEHTLRAVSQIISNIIVLPARDINFGNIYILRDYLILFLLSEQNTGTINIHSHLNERTLFNTAGC